MTRSPAEVLQKPTWQRTVPPLIAAGLVVVLAAALLRPARTTHTEGPLVGNAAPMFTLQSLDGKQVSLADYRGKPVVLNFWASWCSPCREEAPLFQKLSARHGEQVAVIGILFEETKEQNALKFIQEYGLKYPNLRDPGMDIGIEYGVSGIPQTVFIDSNGMIQHLDRGGLTVERFDQGLQKIGLPPL